MADPVDRQGNRTVPRSTALGVEPAEGDRARAARRARDRSRALVIVGVALLLPPLGGLSLMDGQVLGVPIPLFYAFSVWAILVAGGFVLARSLDEEEPAAREDNGTGP